MSLTPDRFEDYFAALHGRSPFPWQRRLCREVMQNGWPNRLALPTASGKTSCIDVALYALATGAPQAPRRILFVVDRRVVVDEAYDHACRIAQSLRDAKSGILREVAESLRARRGDDPSGDNDPLACFQLRGGIYRDNAWARTPSQPTVICSTVDQIGSRLLFRGYGVSDYLQPLHAGLVGNDTLVLLDEAHCSNPFRQTLESVERYRKSFGSVASKTPFAYALLSATLPQPEKDTDTSAPFTLQADDESHDVLGPRLRAEKPTRLVKFDERTATRQFAERLIEQAKGLADGGAKRIGIIVNRVRSAQLVFEQLQHLPTERKALFIGRMRPLDRDASMRQWREVLRSGSAPPDEAVFVVATQCIEVGADLDFDGLVSECASLDALRQRFGRLYRMGRPKNADPIAHPPGVVVIAKDGLKDDDPIYGPALRGTWDWLNQRADEHGSIDFGIAAMNPRLADGAPAQTLVKAEHAPVLLPTYLDQWVQTSPKPEHEAEPALFLRGSHAESPDVQVCWRVDLDPSYPDAWPEIVALCPPSVGECMGVPLAQFKRWMLGEKDIAAGDVEGLDAPFDAPKSDEEPVGKPVLVWKGDRSFPAHEPRKIRPGDTVVVPIRTRGWESLGYIPQGGTDCAERASLQARWRVVVRVHKDLLDLFPKGAAREELESLLEQQSNPDESDPESAIVLQAVRKALEPYTEKAESDWRSIVADSLKTSADKHFRVHGHPGGGWVVERRLPLSRKKMSRFAAISHVADFTTEDDSSSFTVAVPLKAHLAGVANFARAFASACALPEPLVSDIALAASMHDLGKADPRFQSWLRGGAPAFASGTLDGLLAKSSGAQDHRARERARRRAGYPEGGRHELLSLKLAKSSLEVKNRAHDRDLVLHLIASHHGRCRPFAPVVDDPQGCKLEFEDGGHVCRHDGPTATERIDSGVSDRFWRLVRKYGWWGLAYLEAIHILADHRRSEFEQSKTNEAIEGNRDDE